MRRNRNLNDCEYGPACEALEPRKLLSAVLEGETLEIVGSAQSDAIVIEAGELAGQVRLFGVAGVEDGRVFEGVSRVNAVLGAGDDRGEVSGDLRASDGSAMPVRMFGNRGDDELLGGSSVDALFGGPGADVLDGGRFDDRLFGGGGRDTVLGGAGNDMIHGGRQGDVLRGQGGADQLFGGLGLDRVTGGAGADQLFGGGGGDVLLGGLGADQMHGNAGNDVMRAGGGADSLWGDSGSDRLVGGLGNDWLYGGANLDSLVGGGGVDSLLGAVDEVQDRSDSDAPWVDRDGNEIAMDSFSDEFWEALDLSSEALRNDGVDELEGQFDQLEIALDENSDAYFDLLFESLSDAEVEDAAMDAFSDAMGQLGDEFDDYLNDLMGDIGDGVDEFFGDLF